VLSHADAYPVQCGPERAWIRGTTRGPGGIVDWRLVLLPLLAVVVLCLVVVVVVLLLGRRDD
jgi:hypothetical protein